MLGDNFRPWGQLSWVLDHLPKTEWDLLGCLATEDRSLAGWKILKSRNELQRCKLLTVKDLPSAMWQEASDKKLKERQQEFADEGGSIEQVEAHTLFERHEHIIKTAQGFANSAGQNVIVDISSFPKRFFFPIVKVLLRTASIKNLLAVYTVPERYSDAPLAQNPETWRHLPMFMPPQPEPDEKIIFVGLGFEPLGLPQLLVGQEFQATTFKILFPFPAPFKGTQKNWSFARTLEPNIGTSRHQPIRVSPINVSEVFDTIIAETDRGTRYAMFAPYGPKPISLAMCLYASSKSSAVYYTQPRFYNPDYSIGVKTVGGQPAVYGYCLRLNGVDLYAT